MKYFCIISTQRSGTNYVLSIMKRLINASVYEEIFHPSGVMLLSDKSADIKWQIFLNILDQKRKFSEPVAHMISSVLIHNSDDILQKFLAWYSHNRTETFLRSLYQVEGKPFIFKIFPEHVNEEMMKLVLSHPACMGSMILKRDLLESFVSFKTLQITQKPSNFSTDDIKVELDEYEYSNYKSTIETFYEQSIAQLKENRKTHFTVDYSEIIDHINQRDEVSFLTKFCNRLPKDFAENIMISETPSKIVLKKQDSRSIENRVLNPEVIKKIRKFKPKILEIEGLEL